MNGEPSRELETRRVNRATKRVYQVIHTVIQNIILAIRKGTATGRDNMNEQEILTALRAIGSAEMWTTSGETRNKDAWYTVRPERADARALAGEANQHAQRHEHEMAMMYLGILSPKLTEWIERAVGHKERPSWTNLHVFGST